MEYDSGGTCQASWKIVSGRKPVNDKYQVVSYAANNAIKRAASDRHVENILAESSRFIPVASVV